MWLVQKLQFWLQKFPHISILQRIPHCVTRRRVLFRPFRVFVVTTSLLNYMNEISTF